MGELGIGALLLYFVPEIIAFVRGHMSSTAILVLNLLLGWTALGWIVALIWALTSNTRQNFEWRASGQRPDGIGRYVDGALRRKTNPGDSR